MSQPCFNSRPTKLCSYDTLYGYTYEAMAKLLQWSLQLGKYGGVIYCCTHFVTEYMVDFTWCTGPSMLPTVEDDSVLLTEHVSTRLLCKVNRGDVVVFKSPLNPDCFLCKRVVALEFDHMPDETSWRFTRMRQYVRIIGYIQQILV
ncbi:mitochondrial inner membrane protease subunit [Apostichopus japonicus]|uniref:Mitochondrial inner membrane protease subunit n=1 Tax=Stichopus japonicus TaxID=307972 RepID=A0A2G8KM48_STIJA|nr:mitochondrial inner membrane protease subunit [Apostichopus japonicus]